MKEHNYCFRFPQTTSIECVHIIDTIVTTGDHFGHTRASILSLNGHLKAYYHGTQAMNFQAYVYMYYINIKFKVHVVHLYKILILLEYIFLCSLLSPM